MYVPVVDSNQVSLMPTTPSRARRWIKSGKATPFWKKGVFCVRLNVEPSARNYQDIAVGVDPGSKKEGLTVKSEAHDYLNVQAEAVSHVKDRIETRRTLRRSRRNRKTPYRKNKQNRKRGGIPPSTKSRWQWKLRILNWLKQIYPITVIVIEDIKARTKKFQKRWNSSFSPLEVGKQWFYEECRKLGRLVIFQGYETAEKRTELGLKKISNKLSDSFYAHCVDSWVLARNAVGGKQRPENEKVLQIIPFKFFRRQLHKQMPQKRGIRPLFGGTQSLGFKRGSLIKHRKWGLSYVGGTSKNRISLHALVDSKRLAQNVKPTDCQFLTFCSWRWT